jgi:hypothetical protein
MKEHNERRNGIVPRLFWRVEIGSCCFSLSPDYKTLKD